MARRRSGKSLIEGLLDLFVTWPWYVSLALAICIFFGIDTYQQLTPEAAVRPKSSNPGDVVVAAFEPAKAMALTLVKIFLPILLAIASFVSFIKSLLTQRHYHYVEQSPTSASLNEMSWSDFESLTGEYFKREGYTVKPTKKGPDGGVDLRIKKDDRLYLVQCKQWKMRKVPVAVVRELYGLIAAENAAGGFMVTSGELTREALDFAKDKPIYMIDGTTFHRFIRQREKDAVTFPPNHVSKVTVIHCPNCNSPMVKRTARNGANAGRQFWGCRRFPRCYGTRDIQ
ncbi:restriction endonuclease [Idiomarina aquatica]|uniref:Restriction endonuclease n=1 Tax=Idiomarina aquatica TaxID=1327752 RepID=A0AA94EEX0_9GAMM|nr:restriction endonuclease [Idiomarina aquatica]RUO44528.1 restriction endonuclease [Idiomarina aquatica]